MTKFTTESKVCPKCEGRGGSYLPNPVGNTGHETYWSNCPQCHGKGTIYYKVPIAETPRPRSTQSQTTAKPTPASRSNNSKDNTSPSLNSIISLGGGAAILWIISIYAPNAPTWLWVVGALVGVGVAYLLRNFIKLMFVLAIFGVVFYYLAVSFDSSNLSREVVESMEGQIHEKGVTATTVRTGTNSSAAYPETLPFPLTPPAHNAELIYDLHPRALHFTNDCPSALKFVIVYKMEDGTWDMQGKEFTAEAKKSYNLTHSNGDPILASGDNVFTYAETLVGPKMYLRGSSSGDSSHNMYVKSLDKWLIKVSADAQGLMRHVRFNCNG